MPFLNHDGFDLRYETWRETTGKTPVLLIHGFASNLDVNWVGPLWIKTLTDSGYSVIAFDHRGHGKSDSSHNPDDYTPQKMAGDAFALLDYLDISQAHVMGIPWERGFLHSRLWNNRIASKACVLAGLVWRLLKVLVFGGRSTMPCSLKMYRRSLTQER